MSDIRDRVFQKLETIDLETGDPLLSDGYVYRMVAQHEYQHTETMLQALQLKTGEPYAPRERRELPAGRAIADPGAMVRFRGGEVEIGTNDRTISYDNERPRHLVRLAPFDIDVAPVSNAEYLRFMDAGGYQDRAYWSDSGWGWLTEAGIEAPKYWFSEDGRWRTRTMDRIADVNPDRPVCHVCHHEAEAYARFAGKRLPTEFEWEAAASWDPTTRTKRAYPWGDDEPRPYHANLDQLAFEAAPIGAYAENVSPIGCYGMIGDVWEWTSSDFGGYPSYESFPYPEYSEIFFGNEYKVLRGGSWATRPGAIRNTFRNWDYPIRRQIFSGFRCARDA
jgi:iron(II)-dependent oxidoreductase